MAYPILETNVLRAQIDRVSIQPGCYALEAERRLLPVSATFAMAGLLASQTIRPCRPYWSPLSWLSIVWAGLAAVLMAATQSFLPYLVLLALEAVNNAMPLVTTRHAGIGLHERVVTAGLAATPVLVCSLALGLLISRQLRRPSGSALRHGAVVLLAVSAATLAASVALLSIAVPLLDECLAEAFAATLTPRGAAIVVLGFAGLALGPAAHAADRPGSVDGVENGSARLQTFRRFLLGGAALVVIGAVGALALPSAALGIRSWARGSGWVGAALDGWWSFTMRQPWMLFLSPHWVVVALAEIWVTGHVVRVLLTPPATATTPIDAWLEDRLGRRHFAARWGALTALMVALLPVLLVTGIALLDGFFRAMR
jgi:hypothetical protein